MNISQISNMKTDVRSMKYSEWLVYLHHSEICLFLHTVKSTVPCEWRTISPIRPSGEALLIDLRHLLELFTVVFTYSHSVEISVYRAYIGNS
jgi:hypothetical protein